MNITEREIEILRLCHTYAYLDGSYIRNNVFYPEHRGKLKQSQEQYCYRRLRLLVEEGYLYKYPRVRHDYCETVDSIYCLDTKGIHYAKAEFSSELRYRFNPAKHLVPSFNHYLAILRIVENLKRGLRDTEQEFLDFYTEAESYYQFGSEQKERIRPDGVFLVRYHTGKLKGLTLALFLEVERVFHSNRVQENRLINYSKFLNSKSSQRNYARNLNEEVSSFVLFFVGTEHISFSRLNKQLSGLKSKLGAQTVFQHPFFLSKESAIEENAVGNIYQNFSKDDTDAKREIF